MVASRRAERSTHPWRTAVLAGMASYLDAGVIAGTGIALVLYEDALDLSETDIGVLSGLLTIMFAVGALFGGRLGDRFGRRKVFTVSIALYVVGVAFLAFAAAPWMLAVGVVVAGLAVGADLPVSLALIAEEAPEGEKGKLVAFSGFLWLSGIVVVIVLSIALSGLDELGGRILYGQLLAVAVVVLVLRLRLRESAEWASARSVVDAGEDGAVDFSQMPQLLRPPVRAAVLATGLYYALWNLVAGTFTQFGPFLLTELAGTSVQDAVIPVALALPLGIAGALVFMRVVDRPARRGWFTAGTALFVAAMAVPTFGGVSQGTFIAFFLLFGASTGFSGETIYKVWSQELLPTLLRTTGQGVTMAFARLLAALAAFGTPALAVANVSVLFGLLFAAAIASAAIGLFWAQRLPRAVDLGTLPMRIDVHVASTPAPARDVSRPARNAETTRVGVPAHAAERVGGDVGGLR